MNDIQKNNLRQYLSEIQKNNISSNATNSLSVNKFNTFSYKQLYDLKKDINNNIPVISKSDDKN
jgi:hypothetical protein